MLTSIGCLGDSDRSLKTTGNPRTSPSQTSKVSFEDITSSLKLKHAFENGEKAKERSILETIGGGVAILDYDMDGFDDLYFASGGELENKQVTGLGGSLYRSLAARQFVEATSQAAVPCKGIYTHGTLSGDLNDDGFPDLLVTGYHGQVLLINQGDGTFVDVSKSAGLKESDWGTSAALGDFDNDGFLDIYIAHYVDWSFDKHPDCKNAGTPDVCAPALFNGITDAVYFNLTDGTFANKSAEVGLAPEGKGLGVIACDFTQDSLVDIYVANDTTDNFFYQNKGGKLDEIGLANGTAIDDMGTPQGSMGLCTLDYDSDLKPDIMVSNYENQSFALYKNDGDANFRYATSTAGLLALGTTYVSWGSVAADFDLDGDEDVVVANGHVMISHPPEQIPLFLINLGTAKFQAQAFDADSYFAKKWRGRGVGMFDMDWDGDLDLVITHINQDAVVLKNQTETSGNCWKLKLVGTQSNRNAIGARLIVESNKRKLLRNVYGGGSYLSQSSYCVHWGLPADEIVNKVTIYWPSGVQQVISQPSPRTLQMIHEPNR